MALILRDPLMVYPADEHLFVSNGLRLLTPTVAEHTLEFGQAGSIHVEQPLDHDGDWKSLIPGHIIRAPVPFRGYTKWEPFRIYRRTKKRQNGAPLVSVDAMHMFYDLNYVLLEDVRPTQLNCLAALQWLFNRPYDPYGQAAENLPLQYFTFASDITTLASAEYQWKTMTGALIGEDNCILERWGGELYVNGLFFSINSVMENSLQNAFHIAYGLNLTEVEETLDYTNTFSQLVATDNYGNQAHASIPLSYNGLPFEKTLHAAFSYSDDLEGPEQGLRFGSDFSKYMGIIQEVDAHYSVRYADLAPDDPFQELASYEVGDTGVIEDSELEISTTQRIMKTVTNLLTGERISTETGNVKRSIARRQPYSNTVTANQGAAQKQLDALTEQVNDLDFATTVPTPITTAAGAYLTTTGGKYLLYKKG